jgi:ADP-ribose pyrophosphatase YjhB (NUDIX family)
MPRYQGAILKDDHILLIQHCELSGRAYWLLPGGSREEGETETQCIVREMKEETCLDIQVEYLLMEQSQDLKGIHWRKTYLCSILHGEAQPGYEPEPELAGVYRISAVRWVNLRDESSWGDEIVSDHLTYHELKHIQTLIGFA